MFQELMPLLAQRVLVLTLSRTNGEEICVNVIPRPIKAGEKDTNVALTTPLSITGTPAELDLELPKQLVEYVGAHLGLSSTLKTAQEEMAAAAKSAKDAVKKSATTKSEVRPAPVESIKTSAAESAASTEGNSNPAPESANAEPTQSTGNLFEPATVGDAGIS